MERSASSREKGREARRALGFPLLQQHDSRFSTYILSIVYVVFPTLTSASICFRSRPNIFMGKRQKAVYRLVTAPHGGTQKYTLAIAYDSPR